MKLLRELLEQHARHEEIQWRQDIEKQNQPDQPTKPEFKQAAGPQPGDKVLVQGKGITVIHKWDPKEKAWLVGKNNAAVGSERLLGPKEVKLKGGGVARVWILKA